MDDQVRRIQPQDPEIAEVWLRKTDVPDIRAVSASKIITLGGWHVSAWVMQLLRYGPLATELEQRIANALEAVSGCVAPDFGRARLEILEGGGYRKGARSRWCQLTLAPR